MSGRRTCASLGLILWLAAGAAAETEIGGRIINGTTGQPGRAELVRLISLAEGMDEVAEVSGESGSFHFADVVAGGPFLVQADHAGVTYTERVAGKAEGLIEVDLTVYDSTRETTGLKLSEPHAILMARPGSLRVARIYVVENDLEPPRTVIGDPGALLFDYPETADLVDCSWNAGDIPLLCEPVEAGAGAYTVAFPLKPGTSRLELAYEVPYEGEFSYSERVYHDLDMVGVVVVPASLEVEAPDFEDQGTSAREGMSFRSLTAGPVSAGRSLSIGLRGAGTAMGAQGGDAQGGQAEAGGRIEAVPPRSMRGASPALVMGSMFFALCAAAVLSSLRAVSTTDRNPLERQQPHPVRDGLPLQLEEAKRGASRSQAIAEGRMSARAEQLLDALVELEERRAEGETDAAAYKNESTELRASLRAELDESPGRPSGA